MTFETSNSFGSTTKVTVGETTAGWTSTILKAALTSLPTKELQ